MAARQIALYVAGTALLLAGIVIVDRKLATPVERLGSQVDATVQDLVPMPESVQATATYQLFGNRRRAVESMRADLLRLVRAESIFTADSGHPSLSLTPALWPHSAPGNWYNAVRITLHGWHASINNGNTSIMCAVAVGPDTTLDGAPSGVPVCRGQPRQFDF